MLKNQKKRENRAISERNQGHLFKFVKVIEMMVLKIFMVYNKREI